MHDLELERLAELPVEGAQRLVHEQQPRLEDDGPGQRDALLLAAGQLPRIAIAEPIELDEGQRVGDRRLISEPDSAASGAGRRCSGRPSCAGTGRSSGRPCRRRAGAAAIRVMSLAVDLDRAAASGAMKPATIRRVVVLPEPDGPEEREELAPPRPRGRRRRRRRRRRTTSEAAQDQRRALRRRPAASGRAVAVIGRRLAANDEQQQEQDRRHDEERRRDRGDGRVDDLADLLPHLDRQRPEPGRGQEDRDDDLVPRGDEREDRARRARRAG